MQSKFKDESNHVVTTNLKIVDNIDLRDVMQAGTTFRDTFIPFEPKSGTDPEGFGVLSESIDNYKSQQRNQ